MVEEVEGVYEKVVVLLLLVVDLVMVVLVVVVDMMKVVVVVMVSVSVLLNWLLCKLNFVQPELKSDLPVM